MNSLEKALRCDAKLISQMEFDAKLQLRRLRQSEGKRPRRFKRTHPSRILKVLQNNLTGQKTVYKVTGPMAKFFIKSRFVELSRHTEIELEELDENENPKI